MKKFYLVMSVVGFFCALLLVLANRHTGNSEAALAWGVVAVMGFGNICGNLADVLEEVA